MSSFLLRCVILSLTLSGPVLVWTALVAAPPDEPPGSGGGGGFEPGTSAGAPPSNEDCENAFPFPVGMALTSTTAGAVVDDVPFCGTAAKAPGIWFSVLGTGTTLTATTCDLFGGSADYDTRINVYCVLRRDFLRGDLGAFGHGEQWVCRHKKAPQYAGLLFSMSRLPSPVDV